MSAFVAPINKIPHPIMCEIFSYLTAKQLYVLRRVCTHWKDIIHDNDAIIFKPFVCRKYAALKNCQNAISLPKFMSWRVYYFQLQLQSMQKAFDSANLEDVMSRTHFRFKVLTS